MKIFHTVNIFGTDERHTKAKKSWIPLYTGGVEPVWVGPGERNSGDLGDQKKLPFLKDVLKAGIDASGRRGDVILWSNDDVVLDERIVSWCADDVVENGAMTMRRFEPETPDSNHIGREVMSFTVGWLQEKLPEIPDFLQGAPCFDMVIAAIIRDRYNVKSDLDNMLKDYPLCEARERYAIHHAHPSSWATKDRLSSPANIYNVNLARTWCRKNMPSLKL